MIRIGRMDDLENIIEIGTKLLEKSNNHDVPVDRHTVFSVVREFVRAPDKTILLADHDGQITMDKSPDSSCWPQKRFGGRTLKREGGMSQTLRFSRNGTVMDSRCWTSQRNGRGNSPELLR
jgi:hypothetical protein